jgi:hypothetical protein
MIRVLTPNLYQPKFDFFFILFPAFISVIVAFLFGDYFTEQSHQPIWIWVLLVVGIDVSHVWSTLYKTYLHQKESSRLHRIFFFIPVIVLVSGILIHTFSAIFFWTLLAYLAVFHFIRQQYGFMRLYSRNETQAFYSKFIDGLMIYSATVYPIIYWHTHPRNFHWFMEGDFILGLPTLIDPYVLFLYVAICTLYIFKELLILKTTRSFNLSKNLLVLGTAISWYVGIVLFNGDFTFTVTNIIAHGIPYLALIWAWGKGNNSRIINLKGAVIPFLGLILLLAYLEEGLWAGFVWREHLEFFGWSKSLPEITDKKLLSFLVPLLTLPQATHYILDGFIWKNFDKK